MQLQDKCLQHFETLAQQIEKLNPQKTVATLSRFDALLDILEDPAAWPCPTLDLLRGDNGARKFIRELLYLIERRKKLEQRPELRSKTLTHLVRLLLFNYQHSYFFPCEGDLEECLREDITEKEACDYYHERVVGSVQDKFGQRVFFWKYALNHLYKDRADKHSVAPEYFQQSRAHRLPWIRHVVTNSKEVYREARSRHGVPNLVYVGHTVLGMNADKYPQDFFVIVQFNRSRQASFLTAFHAENDRKEFLRHLADWFVDSAPKQSS
jgi:hypothetical protein